MSDSMLQELSARMPALIPLNLYELDAISATLASAQPKGKRPTRKMRRLIVKIERARDRKRKRAGRKAKFW